MEALTDNERDLRVLRLLELIAHINGTIKAHRNAQQPDPAVVTQYVDRRAEYLLELTELMGEGYAIEAQFRPLEQAA